MRRPIHRWGTASAALVLLTIGLSMVCACTDGYSVPRQQAYLDEWRVVAEGNVSTLKFLSIGDRLTYDNFANRGDIEVIYDSNANGITVEMQRFVTAWDQEQAAAELSNLQYWGYNSAEARILDPVENADLLCFTPGNDFCYIRMYSDSASQSIYTGANFRITLPAGWDGDLEIVTSDNVEVGARYYPDRSDVDVTGLSGSLRVDLDSGNVNVSVDSNVDHFSGCASNDICEMGEPDAMPPVAPFDPSCGCTQPTTIVVNNATGQSSNITIDVPTNSKVSGAGRWYNILLENWAGPDSICSAIIDCEAFGEGCLIDSEFSNTNNIEKAEINYPGLPATTGAGIQIQAHSDSCADVEYLENPEDYDSDEDFPSEQRGNLRLCSGCLQIGLRYAKLVSIFS
ncbi:purine-nucleoside phosphorylase [Nannocystaceae bacterium ST9]